MRIARLGLGLALLAGGTWLFASARRRSLEPPAAYEPAHASNAAESAADSALRAMRGPGARPVDLHAIGARENAWLVELLALAAMFAGFSICGPALNRRRARRPPGS